MTSIELLSEVDSITRKNMEFIQKNLTKFSESQLKWKPNSLSWNLLEIFAHLNEYARFYHAAFAYKIEITKFREPKSQFISSPLGKSACKSMKLGNLNNIKRKFNAHRSFNPTVQTELVNGSDIEIFQEKQSELLELIEKAKLVNIQRVKVPIAISKLIRLRLGDALLFVVYHNERHIQQAFNIIEHRAFPKN
jgi:hypothetical protein